MRLVISGGSFRLEDVPGAVDLSELQGSRGIAWSERCRRLTWTPESAGRVREALARRGVRLADDEVRSAVARALEDDVLDAPAYVAAFGDARAIPELARVLDEYAPRLDCAVCDYLAVLGLLTAILLLGGAPTEPWRRKVVEYEQRQRGAWSDGGGLDRSSLAAVAPLAHAAPAVQATRRLGRNQPCRCGSGKKYKNCHLALDEAPAATHR